MFSEGVWLSWQHPRAYYGSQLLLLWTVRSGSTTTCVWKGKVSTVHYYSATQTLYQEVPRGLSIPSKFAQLCCCDWYESVCSLLFNSKCLKTLQVILALTLPQMHYNWIDWYDTTDNISKSAIFLVLYNTYAFQLALREQASQSTHFVHSFFKDWPFPASFSLFLSFLSYKL